VLPGEGFERRERGEHLDVGVEIADDVVGLE